jgi:hypothetical protein
MADGMAGEGGERGLSDKRPDDTDVEIRVIGPVDPEWLGLTVVWFLHPIGG